ncbi:MAG: HAMP domain-containing sensor histidine kinase [Candidatus Krumholzibacteria bacterium]|nr:HAMP domain-containing sensor histidine kinase [Candidatus Krumholzibacteria bacterium]
MRAPRNLPFLLKVYIIAGSVIVVAFALVYNNRIIKKMSAQSAQTTRKYARFIAHEMDRVDDQSSYGFMRETVLGLNAPFIITDEAGRPMVWSSQIGLPMLSSGDVGDDIGRLMKFNPAFPNDPMLEKVLRKAQAFDRMNEPAPMEGKRFKALLHFGPSSLSRELAVAQYVQIGVFVIFVLFGFLGFRAMKSDEQRSIWVGMAKETAHQLGTPLSSIMGWIAMIREELAAARGSDKLAMAIDEVETDVERLSKISARFSKIGSAPKLELQELAPIVDETVRYFERRRPSLKINSTITTESDELPLIRCSKELIGWVLENLIKNALDAIAGDEGKIHIQCRMNEKDRRVEILFSDSGKGMSPGVRKRVFSPGFTTKNRGWGLGLSLAKRIVEDMHGGSIRVLESQPGKGTTFLLTFPVD